MSGSVPVYAIRERGSLFPGMHPASDCQGGNRKPASAGNGQVSGHAAMFGIFRATAPSSRTGLVTDGVGIAQLPLAENFHQQRSRDKSAHVRPEGYSTHALPPDRQRRRRAA